MALQRAPAFEVETVAGKKILNGREAGVQLFDNTIKYLEGLPTERVVPLSFSGIDFLDFSCADEFLAKILRRIRSGELEGKFIVIKNASETVLENIEIALRERDCCCPLEDAAGKIRPIGKISDPLSRTYHFSLSRRKITTNDVFEHFKREALALSAASNRLVSLNRMGLLYRVTEASSEHGGKQYIYEAVA